jgi:hypothetical protein
MDDDHYSHALNGIIIIVDNTYRRIGRMTLHTQSGLLTIVRNVGCWLTGYSIASEPDITRICRQPFTPVRPRLPHQGPEMRQGRCTLILGQVPHHPTAHRVPKNEAPPTVATIGGGAACPSWVTGLTQPAPPASGATSATHISTIRGWTSDGQIRPPHRTDCR